MLEVLLLAAGASISAPPGVGQEHLSIDVQLRHEICFALATAPLYPADLPQCLSFDSAHNAAFSAYACNFLRDTEQLEDFRFPTYATCLRNLLAK